LQSKELAKAAEE